MHYFKSACSWLWAWKEIINNLNLTFIIWVTVQMVSQYHELWCLVTCNIVMGYLHLKYRYNNILLLRWPVSLGLWQYSSFTIGLPQNLCNCLRYIKFIWAIRYYLSVYILFCYHLFVLIRFSWKLTPFLLFSYYVM